MPIVRGYKRQIDTSPIQPVKSGVQMDTQSLSAAIKANQPDSTAAEAQRAAAIGGVRRQENAKEIRQAGDKLVNVQGMQTARLQENAAKGIAAASRLNARAVESTGQILTAMSARLQKMQDDRDAADMFNAVEEWRGYVNKYWNDPESGVKATRQYNNASGLYEETRGYLNELTSRVSGKLRTDEMKMKFQGMIMSHRESAERDASVWETKQLDAYSTQTAERTINNALSSVMENPSRENFNANFELAQNVIIERMRGADEETIGIALGSLRSQFQASIVSGQLDKDPIKAEAYYNAVKEEILPETRIKLEPQVQKAAMVVKGQTLAESMLQKYGPDNLADAQQEVRDNFQGEEEEEYLRAVNARFSDEIQARREIETKQYDSMVGKIRRKTGGYQALRHEVDSLEDVDEVTRFQLFDLLDSEFKIGTGGSGGGTAGGMGKTDPATYHEIWDMIDNNTLLEKAPDWATFRSLFKDRLSITKLEEFGKTIYKNVDGGAAADPEIKMQQAGLFNKMMDDEKIEDPQVRARAIDRYNFEVSVAEAVSAKKGRPFGYEDRALIMKNVIAPVIVGKTRTWYGRQTDQTRRRFEIPPGAELRDGVWYFPDASGKWIPLIFEDE